MQDRGLPEGGNVAESVHPTNDFIVYYTNTHACKEQRPVMQHPTANNTCSYTKQQAKQQDLLMMRKKIIRRMIIS